MKRKSNIALRLLILALLMSLLILPATTLAQGDDAPRSSMMAITLVDAQDTGAFNIADFVKARVRHYAQGLQSRRLQFPLANAATDSVRTLGGLRANVVVSWLEPLTWDDSPEAPRFGANNDYIAYFGEGWQDDPGLAPQFKGRGNEGWVWVNHEYISNEAPTATSAPTGQHLTLAKFLSAKGVLTNDITSDDWEADDLTTYINFYKKQLGGSWFRIVQDPSTGEWTVDRSADNKRYDATSNTLLAITGHELRERDQHDETGRLLPEGVVSGIMGDCSGGQTPWGTIITAEENVQDYYGDLEACWTGQNAFVEEAGFDPGSAISPSVAPSTAGAFGQIPDPDGRHNRDFYGYLVEMDPGADPSDYYESVDDDGEGQGHRKIGSMGRARWENATFVVGPNWELIPDQPIVMYGGSDRYSGRVYKWVSQEVYEAGMSRAEIRALLDEGTVYVAHFAGLDYDTGYTVDGEIPTEASPGEGRWIEMSVDSTDIAPNAEALDEPDTTVGEALQDVTWNNIGGFETDNDVESALFTASNKIGVAELNRPEDVEWNANDLSGTPRLYIAFTKHTRQVALDQDGVLFDPEVHAEESPRRADNVGSIFALQEANPADLATSKTFTYFVVWRGSEGSGVFDAANPDNMMIDRDGGLWFGTDGNFGTNGRADGLYYLDLNPRHRASQPGIIVPTYSRAFRVVAGPSDSEATGPAFSSDMDTIFFNVQHPGERVYSTWPHAR